MIRIFLLIIALIAIQSNAWAQLRPNQRVIYAGLAPYSVTSYCGSSSPADQTSNINSALATGLQVVLPDGCFLVSSQLKYAVQGQVLSGSGINTCTDIASCTGSSASAGTLIYAASASGYNAGQGIINMAYPGGSGQALENLSVIVAQPDTATRSSLTSWVPEVYAEGTTRARITNVRLEACIICIDATGNAGGIFLDTVELSGFGTTSTGESGVALGGLIVFDGSEDTMRLTNVHEWPFGLTTNQMSIMESTGTVCLNSGRVDDLQVANRLSFCGTSANFFYGTTSAAGGTFGSFVNDDSDTFGNMTMSGNGANTDTGPTLTFSSSFWTLGSGAPPAITMTAGHVVVNGGVIFNTSSGSTPIVGISDSSGFSTLNWIGGYISLGGSNITAFSGSGTYKTFLTLSSTYFNQSANVGYSRPVITLTGNVVRGNIAENYITDKGTGTGTFIKVGTDNYNIVVNNNAPGWSLSLPTGTTTGIYTPNL